MGKQAKPEAAGIPVRAGQSALPYLFKVLSVSKALSIQAHPDKELAERLHRDAPALYKDDNHKPEIAIALTPFEAMCGFRPLPQVAAFLEVVPELRSIVGEEESVALVRSCSSSGDADDHKAALRNAFAAFMGRHAAAAASAVRSLVERLVADPTAVPAVRDLVLRLDSQFPSDIGVFAPFWLNVQTLAPGEGIFLAANEPHAYLAGDCVECMANSDNVVRAGLTPKHKDVPTLVEMLTYRCVKWSTWTPRLD